MKEEMTQLEFEKANGEMKNRKVFRADYEIINDFREKNLPDLDLSTKVKKVGKIPPQPNKMTTKEINKEDMDKPLDLEQLWLRAETLLNEERYKRHMAEVKLLEFKIKHGELLN